jgi:hypothetical protein
VQSAGAIPRHPDESQDPFCRSGSPYGQRCGEWILGQAQDDEEGHTSGNVRILKTKPT